MDIILSKIKSGIESYKKVFPKKYKYITDRLDPIKLAVAIAKIESNFNYKAKGKGGEYGLYQFTPGTLNATIRSYTKNVSASKRLFYKYANSQTFVFMQLVYLNLKNLDSNGGKLNPKYEKVILTLPIFDRNIVRVAILHNQGISALKRQAKRYNPLVFYVPQLLGALQILKKPKTNIASATAVGYGVWQGIQIAFPELRVAGILTKLAVLAVVAYAGYKASVKANLTEIINDTNEAYRQQLRDRFKIVFYAEGSKEAKEIADDLKDLPDHPLSNKPGSNKKPEKKPKKKWPKPSAGDVGKIIVATGAGKALSDVGDGIKDAMDNLSKSAGETVKDIPGKITDILSNPMFLGAVVGVVFLMNKKR